MKPQIYQIGSEHVHHAYPDGSVEGVGALCALFERTTHMQNITTPNDEHTNELLKVAYTFEGENKEFRFQRHKSGGEFGRTHDVSIKQSKIDPRVYVFLQRHLPEEMNILPRIGLETFLLVVRGGYIEEYLKDDVRSFVSGLKGSQALTVVKNRVSNKGVFFLTNSAKVSHAEILNEGGVFYKQEERVKCDPEITRELEKIVEACACQDDPSLMLVMEKPDLTLAKNVLDKLGDNWTIIYL